MVLSRKEEEEAEIKVLAGRRRGTNLSEGRGGPQQRQVRHLFIPVGRPTGEKRRSAANTLTKDGNLVLMWVEWAGSLNVVKLLVQNRVDPTVANQNGCTVAHWAVSEGNLDECQYLLDVAGVDLAAANRAGNSSLSHAVAYGRVNVVRWLRNEVGAGDNEGKAKDLAWDFIGWAEDDDHRRRKVFNLFQDWDAP